MKEDTRNKEYVFWNDEWNYTKDDKHTEILFAEINNSILNLNKDEKTKI
jgi:hypothetical protein